MSKYQRAAGLETQALTPLTSTHEMGQSLDIAAVKLSRKGVYIVLFKQAFGSDTITGKRIVNALARFERTLISANSRYDQYLVGKYQPSELERQGIALFYTGPSPGRNVRGAGCAHCHAGPRTFNELFHNNGLDSFSKDPGREKITGQSYDRGRFLDLTQKEKAALEAFLNMLTDSTFITDKRFSNPFLNHQ